MSEKVRFLSDHTAQRMLRRSAPEQIMPNGTVAVTGPEIVYEFDKGALELRSGQDVLADKWDDEKGTWVEQDAISWMRSTPEYGDTVHEVLPQAPDPAPLFVEIGRLQAAGDVDALIALGDQEHATWNRDQVLGAISGAIAELEAPSAA